MSIYIGLPLLVFQSTLPCGSDRLICYPLFRMKNFNPRSLAGATCSHTLGECSQKFQSTLPCGSDSVRKFPLFSDCNFNPRSLAGATVKAVMDRMIASISIHAPLRERLVKGNWDKAVKYISIHAPLRERHYRLSWKHPWTNFNPRSLAGATAIFSLSHFLK